MSKRAGSIPKVACRGCGAEASPDGPVPDRCGMCPPETCVDCGQLDDMTAPCACWTAVSDLPIAELKSVFARGGLSINTGGRDGTA